MNAGIAVTVGLTLAFVGVAGSAVRKFRRAGIEMDMLEFFQRLIRGKGFSEISPLQLRQMTDETPSDALILDLRPEASFASGHIPGAVSDPFDDFLRELVVNGKYSKDKDREIILVCDTGHMSRVAAAIMAEDEGFTRVLNLSGGMKRWQRTVADGRPRRTCCPALSFAHCCR